MISHANASASIRIEDIASHPQFRRLDAIAGIAYEVLRWTAKNLHRPWVRVMIKPNLALQHLTTRQPSLDMLEVAIAAFKHVLVSEGELDASEVAQYKLAEDQPKVAAQPAVEA